MRARLVSGLSIVAVAAVAAGTMVAAPASPAPTDSTATPMTKGPVISGDALQPSGAPVTPAAPTPVLPGGLAWAPAPGLEGLLAAWVLGSEATSGPYLLRVRLAEGARIPPHSHPDHRVTTVLSGTAYVGFGSQFDEKALVKIPAGGVYQVPAGVPHYAWARDGDVEYQESGVGPTGTTVAKP